MTARKILASTVPAAAMAIVTALLAIAFCTASITVPAVADEFNRTVLPIPDQPFKGKTGLRLCVPKTSSTLPR